MRHEKPETFTGLARLQIEGCREGVRMSVKYSGDLVKSIPPPVVGPLMDDEQIAAITAALVRERYRRMTLLFDAHSIEHGNWEALCFASADAHVPGLRVATKKAGRRSKWDCITRAELVIAVEQTGIKNISKATAKLAEIEPWKSLVSHTRGGDSLKDEFTRADLRWVQVLRDARAWEALEGKNKGKAARK